MINPYKFLAGGLLAGSLISIASRAEADGTWVEIYRSDFTTAATSDAQFQSIYGRTWSKGFAWGNTAGHTPNTYYAPGNIRVRNGALEVMANGSPMAGYRWRGGAVTTGPSKLLLNAADANQAVKIEARVWVPFKQGVTPALWLIPEDFSWPPEIDIFEIPGGVSQQGRTAFFTLHYPPDGDAGSSYTADVPLTGAWHTYAMEWWYDGIRWSIDGVVRAESWSTANTPHQPMYLMLTMEVNNNPSWNGTPPAGNWSSVMKVDWIRVSKWQ